MTVVLSLAGLRGLATDLANVSEGLAYVGERGLEVIRTEGMAAGGGDGVLSGFHNVRTRLDAKAITRGTTIILMGTPPGPWTLVESGSHKTAWLEPRSGSKRRLRLADGHVRSKVTHGPVRGRRAFTKAATRIADQAQGWFDRWVTDQLRGAA